jgi:hypothetical protein
MVIWLFIRQFCLNGYTVFNQVIPHLLKKSNAPAQDKEVGTKHPHKTKTPAESGCFLIIRLADYY